MKKGKIIPFKAQIYWVSKCKWIFLFSTLYLTYRYGKPYLTHDGWENCRQHICPDYEWGGDEGMGNRKKSKSTTRITCIVDYPKKMWDTHM